MSRYECYLATSNNTTSNNIYDTWTNWAPTQWQRQWVPVRGIETPSSGTEIKQPLKEGIEMKNLYEVFLVYGEDRKNPFISATERVIASDDEDARVKSGIYSRVEKEWDADYLTIIVHNLGAVKIKEKAKEVKNV